MRVANSWVKVGRPDPLADRRTIDGHRRPIIVGGAVVGHILPLTVGTLGRPDRVPRWAKWEIRGYAAQARSTGMYGDPSAFQAYRQCGTLACAVRCSQSWDGWPVACWVYLSGDRGYMPDNSGCCVGRYGAVEGLIETFELGNGRRARSLRRTGWTALDSRRDGAEYAEVSPCECESCATGCTVATADTWECRLCD